MPRAAAALFAQDHMSMPTCDDHYQSVPNTTTKCQTKRVRGDKTEVVFFNEDRLFLNAFHDNPEACASIDKSFDTPACFKVPRTKLLVSALRLTGWYLQDDGTLGYDASRDVRCAAGEARAVAQVEVAPAREESCALRDEERAAAAERRAAAAEQRAANAELRAANAEQRAAAAELLAASAVQRSSGLRAPAFRITLGYGQILAQGPAFEHGIAARAAEATRTASEATARAGRAANAVSETKRRKRVAPGGKSVMWTSKAEADAEAERAAVEAASFAWSQFPFE